RRDRLVLPSFPTRRSSDLEFDMDEERVVRNVTFHRGCSGNTQGVALLANGRPADELIHLLRGVHCGFRPTSCPDQFARALEKALDRKSTRLNSSHVSISYA